MVRPGEVHVVANPDGTIDLLPTAEAAKAAAERKAAEEADRGRPLSPAQKELAVQCFALKLLSGGFAVRVSRSMTARDGTAEGAGGAVLHAQAANEWAACGSRHEQRMAGLRAKTRPTRTLHHPQAARSCTSSVVDAAPPPAPTPPAPALSRPPPRRLHAHVPALRGRAAQAGRRPGGQGGGWGLGRGRLGWAARRSTGSVHGGLGRTWLLPAGALPRGRTARRPAPGSDWDSLALSSLPCHDRRSRRSAAPPRRAARAPRWPAPPPPRPLRRQLAPAVPATAPACSGT